MIFSIILKKRGKLEIFKLSFIIFIAFWASCQKYQESDKVKTLIKQKKYDQALQEAQKESNLIKKLNYLGIIYSKKGNFKKSESCYNKVLEKDSKNFKALYNLGILKTKSRNFKEALNIFSKLENLYPEKTDIKIKKAWVHYYLLSNSNAIGILKKIVNKNRKTLTLNQWKEISKLYENLKRYRASAEAYDYYLSKVKQQNIKTDIKKAQIHLEKLKSQRNQEL